MANGGRPYETPAAAARRQVPRLLGEHRRLPPLRQRPLGLGEWAFGFGRERGDASRRLLGLVGTLTCFGTGPLHFGLAHPAAIDVVS